VADGLLIVNCGELVTMSELGDGPQRGPLSDLETLQDAAVWCADGLIRDIGRRDDVMRGLPNNVDPELLDAGGACVIPGLVDPHSHRVYLGSREDEFEMRVAGIPYPEIARRGGGIIRTVAETRRGTFDDLLRAVLGRLDRALASGTTTTEVKTGYGLTMESELLALDVLAAADRAHVVDLVMTFLPAHAVPSEFASNPDAYVDLIVEEMIPRAVGRARYVDVFCEQGYFTPDQARRVLAAAEAHGFGRRIHADEFSDLGGATIAAELRCASADHLCWSAESGLRAMAAAGVVAVVLPGSRFFLLADRYANARRMIELGVPIALGTDHSPTGATESMLFVIALACAELRMTPSEALVASTRNAAFSIGLGAHIGTLAKGRDADLVILDVPTYRQIPYYVGRDIVRAVVKKGAPAWRRAA